MSGRVKSRAPAPQPKHIQPRLNFLPGAFPSLLAPMSGRPSLRRPWAQKRYNPPSPSLLVCLGHTQIGGRRGTSIFNSIGVITYRQQTSPQQRLALFCFFPMKDVYYVVVKM